MIAPMPPRRARWLLPLALCAVLGAATLRPPAPPPPSPVTRGVALGLFASDPDYDYGAMLTELRDRGADEVLLVVNWTQRDLAAHDIAPAPGWSPSHRALDRTLTQARALGLRASIMPVVRLRDRSNGAWRGQISPRAGADAWFDAWRGLLLPLADLAQKHQVNRLFIGSELSSMEAHERHWRALIAQLRGRYRGRLTYSANWDHFDQVPFWDALDEVAVTAYFPLASPGEDPDADALRAAWRAPQQRLHALRARTGKPLLLSEVGYPAHRDAAARPWDERLVGDPGPGALQRQAALLQGFCDAFLTSPTADGFFFWNWFGVGGPSDLSYSPRGKPAAATIEACLRDPRWQTPQGGSAPASSPTRHHGETP
jgi:hypothetical protein